MDNCLVCAGEQGPDHKHMCAYCGADAGARALVVGDDSTENIFYCDEYCMKGGEAVRANGDLDADEPAVLILAARKIKSEMLKRGIRWESV